MVPLGTVGTLILRIGYRSHELLPSPTEPWVSSERVKGKAMFVWQHVRNLLESSDQASKADSLRALQRALEETTDGGRVVARAIENVLEEASV